MAEMIEEPGLSDRVCDFPLYNMTLERVSLPSTFFQIESHSDPVRLLLVYIKGTSDSQRVMIKMKHDDKWMLDLITVPKLLYLSVHCSKYF